MSFMSGVRGASPKVFGKYLSNVLEAVFELTSFEDIGIVLALAVGYLALCALWVILMGIVSAISDLFSRGSP